jgi:uncharacterized protein YecT (DUF1311 family)
MKLRHARLAALALALPWTTARAADGATYGDHSLSRAYHLCLGPNPSNAELGQCLETEADLQESWLNAAYRRKMTSLPAARREALRASERIWVKRRERACEAAYKEMEGGTGAGPARLICLASGAASRIRWIAAFR